MNVYKVRVYNSIWFGGLKHITEGEEHYVKGEVLPNIMKFFRFVKRNGNGACWGVLLLREHNDGRKEVLLPSPADIVGKRKKGGEWRLLEYDEKLKCPLIRGILEAFEGAGDYFISLENFKKWKSYEPGVELQKISELIKREIKVGLKVDKDKGVAQESMLFFQERIRPIDGVNFLFTANVVYEKKSFFGGERNPASVEELKEEEILKNIKEILYDEVPIKNGSYYRLYILTHTFINNNLENGEKHPISIREVSSDKKVEFDIVWVFSRGSVFVSGNEKPAVNMLLPGTVLLLKAKGDTTLKSLCQVISCPEENSVKNFLDSGWNTGILVKGRCRNE